MPVTFFARAENVGRKPNGDDDVHYGRDGRAHLNSDLPAILAAFRAFQSGEPAQHDARWYTAHVAANFAAHENGRRLDFPFHHPSRLEAQRRIEACAFPHSALGKICAERKEVLVPAQDLPGVSIPYTGLANIEAHTGQAEQVQTPADSLKSGVKRYEFGDILFAKMRPNLRKVALVSFDEPGYTSPECAVLTIRRGGDGLPTIDPLLLSVVLRSDFVYGQIMHLVAGIGRPRISSAELFGVRIPIPPHDVQRALLDGYSAAREQAARLEEEGLALQQRARTSLLEAVTAVAEGFARREAE